MQFVDVRSDQTLCFKTKKHKTNINVQLTISTGDREVTFKGPHIKQPPELAYYF